MIHQKLISRVWGIPLAYVVWQCIKVSHILPDSNAYLTFDEEMIAIAPIVKSWSNLKINQDGLDKAYANVSTIYSRLTMPWCTVSSQRFSQT